MSGKHSREMGNGANFSAIYPKEQLENQNWAHEMGSGVGIFLHTPTETIRETKIHEKMGGGSEIFHIRPQKEKYSCKNGR